MSVQPSSGWFTARQITAAAIVFLLGCGDDSVTPDDPASEEIVVTDQEHHLGDNTGAEGVEYDSSFQVSAPFDSASVAITFLYPNSLGVSGPEIGNPPTVFVNTIQIGLSESNFPDDPACVVGTGPSREYFCDITVSLPATGEVVVGSNSIRVAGEAAAGGNDDFVFTDLVVTLWR